MVARKVTHPLLGSKLSPRFTGPYLFISIKESVAKLIHFKSQQVIISNLDKLKKYKGDPNSKIKILKEIFFPSTDNIIEPPPKMADQETKTITYTPKQLENKQVYNPDEDNLNPFHPP